MTPDARKDYFDAFETVNNQRANSLRVPMEVSNSTSNKEGYSKSGKIAKNVIRLAQVKYRSQLV
jgi:hypothetical protein